MFDYFKVEKSANLNDSTRTICIDLFIGQFQTEYAIGRFLKIFEIIFDFFEKKFGRKKTFPTFALPTR